MIQFVHIVNKQQPQETQQPKQEPQKPKEPMLNYLIIFLVSILLGMSSFASIYTFEWYITVGLFYIFLRSKFIDAILLKHKIIIVSSHLLGLFLGIIYFVLMNH
jgi:hypothetical protein